LGRRVVIAEDEASLRALLRHFVERDDRFEVVAEAVDGTDALEAVELHDPDVLLLDVRLPGLDGLEVLQRLRGRPRPRTVVLTGYDDPQMRERVATLGAVACLVKGRDFASLVEAMAEAG
jgi:DNA-binding NarL/FixJ family response regulator